MDFMYYLTSKICNLLNLIIFCILDWSIVHSVLIWVWCTGITLAVRSGGIMCPAWVIRKCSGGVEWRKVGLRWVAPFLLAEENGGPGDFTEAFRQLGRKVVAVRGVPLGKTVILLLFNGDKLEMLSVSPVNGDKLEMFSVFQVNGDKLGLRKAQRVSAAAGVENSLSL
nr:hypothetical protein Iba_chr02dCG4910 [Ipomoea batatas]